MSTGIAWRRRSWTSPPERQAYSNDIRTAAVLRCRFRFQRAQIAQHLTAVPLGPAIAQLCISRSTGPRVMPAIDEGIEGKGIEAPGQGKAAGHSSARACAWHLRGRLSERGMDVGLLRAGRASRYGPLSANGCCGPTGPRILHLGSRAANDTALSRRKGERPLAEALDAEDTLSPTTSTGGLGVRCVAQWQCTHLRHSRSAPHDVELGGPISRLEIEAFARAWRVSWRRSVGDGEIIA